MNLIEDIKTIKNPVETKFKEKASVFIGKPFHVLTEIEAEKILVEIRKKYYDAAHHCYAYKLASDIRKYSDDGEPSGSAGLRILNAIEHFELTNCIVVIIRYFGGTKLGVGPLGKAYYTTAFQTLQLSDIIEQKLFRKASIVFDFQFLNQCHRIIANYNAKILESNYDSNVNLVCLFHSKDINNVIIELTEISKGQIKMLAHSEYCYL